MNNNKTLGRVLMILTLLVALGCNDVYSPKPRGYFRIDFPEKEYQRFVSPCGFSFDYPVYGTVNEVTLSNAEPCWYDVNFKDYHASIHLTYKPVKNDLSGHIEDVRRIVYKHIIKADDIIEIPIANDTNNVSGIIYDIKGNAASSLNFYITDKSTGFLSGSLYFNAEPNVDSLAPAIKFFREDIVHLIHSFSWE